MRQDRIQSLYNTQVKSVKSLSDFGDILLQKQVEEGEEKAFKLYRDQ